MLPALSGEMGDGRRASSTYLTLLGQRCSGLAFPINLLKPGRSNVPAITMAGYADRQEGITEIRVILPRAAVSVAKSGE
jgi:hypothetical protein